MVIAAWVVAGLSLALGAWAAASALRDRAVVLRQLIGAGVVEVALIGQAVVAVVALARGHDLAEPLTFWGYVVFALLILPGVGVVALVERTRWSSVVLLIGCLTIAVMELRMTQVWG